MKASSVRSRKAYRLDEATLDAYTKLIAGYEPYSDFDPTSLWCWSADEASFLTVNDNILLCLRDYVSDSPVYTLLGNNDIDRTLHEVLAESGQLTMVPEVVVDAIEDMTSFVIKEERDNADYIMSVCDLADMQGGVYKKKRNKIAKVICDIGPSLDVKSGQLSATDRKIALELFDSWARQGDKAQARAERRALERLWSKESTGQTLVTWVTFEGKPVGFSVNELLKDKMAICHFEKTLKVHENLNTFMVREVAKELRSHGVRYVNWEQDLGIQGLRASKQSYGPTRMLKKFSVTLAA